MLSISAWRRIAESKIEQAIQEGELDDLPGFGRPFEFDELTYDENWWIKSKSRREQLTVLPPALVLRREVDRRIGKIFEMRNESEVRAAIVQLNDFIRRSNTAILWGPPSDAIEFDVDQFVGKWRDRRKSPGS